MVEKSQSFIKTIAIVGGGTAGWMSAAALSRMLLPENVKLVLIESEQIGTIGVGEATIPDVKNFNRMLGIDEQAFLSATHGTFKLGIEFCDWGKIGDRYFHPFGEHGVDMNGIDFHQYWLHSKQAGNPKALEEYSLCAVAGKRAKFALPDKNPRSVLSHLKYAYHFDASAYALFLRNYAEKNGVTRVEGQIEGVVTHPESGNINAVTLVDGKQIEADFFIDCTGFKALLIGNILGTKYRDWSHWLPCNSAQAVASERTEPLLPYTISTAKTAGWQWRIPTQHRTGNGHIYCNDFITDDQAKHTLLDGLDANALTEPRVIRFQTGCREEFWVKNCVAIGLSSGFLEPLESTSIFLIQQGISRFISFYPTIHPNKAIKSEYNRLMKREFEQVRDFIILHYYATERNDSEFWNYCRNMPIPDSLKNKMELFKAAGRVFRDSDELFAKPSWVAVMLGQHIYPSIHEPILNGISDTNIKDSLQSMHAAMLQTVKQLPTHAEFIRHYASTANCK